MPNKKNQDSHHFADNLKDNLKETFENLHVDEEMEKMKKTAKEIADVSTEFIKKYPLQTVAGAAVVGFLIGIMVRRD